MEGQRENNSPGAEWHGRLQGLEMTTVTKESQLANMLRTCSEALKQVTAERDAEIERLTGVAFLACVERDEARMEISTLKDQRPVAYGIRQITDDEGVEEWEDIRTSPDVAKDEADGMMETGRGERYEVVPLYLAAGAQPAPKQEPFDQDYESDTPP